MNIIDESNLINEYKNFLINNTTNIKHKKYFEIMANQFKEKKYEFVNEDCLEYLKKKDDKSIDLVITSPPYNLGIKYSKYDDKKPREKYLLWVKDIFTEIKRTLKDDGHIFLNIGYTNKDPWVSMEVALQLKDLFVLQNKITWVKSIHINGADDDKNIVDSTFGHFKPINSERYINVTNEDIYHFTKTDDVKINRNSIGVPFKWKCNLKNRKTGAIKEDKRCKGNSWFLPYDTINSKKEKGNHPATFPEKLVEHCIRVSNIKKGIILDPFSGSGTSVCVAKKFNLNNDDYNLSAIGIDIDEKYINFSKKRLMEIN